ncbi:MAG: cell division protein FtsA [Candidatus Saccharibacteria bacterium]|nr:cell division protein FtsA [Candidatus Saccharibacteria bacterium]
MREQTPTHFVGLDIGTQNVRCVVGMVDEADPTKPTVIGHGSAMNHGMRKGVITHVDDVADAVSHAIMEAERLSGVHIQHATVNVNGSHVSGINSKGVIAVSTADKEIGEDERLRVEEAATIVQLPPNREIIQVFAKNYRIDGQDNIKDPIGMQGVRLEVDTHIVTALAPNVRNLELVLEKSKLKSQHKTLSSLAASEAVLDRKQKEAGTLLVDIGAGTTNLSIIEDGEVHHVAVIPVGSINLTNDLAIGLKTELEIAEKVKLEYAILDDSNKDLNAKVEHDGRSHLFEMTEVKMITEARIEELFELIDKELKAVKRSRKLPGGVVFVGGGAKIPGLEGFAKEKLQLAARPGALQPLSGLVDVVDDGAYASAVGLMLLDMVLIPDENAVFGRPNTKAFGFIDGLMGKIGLKK